MEMQNNIMSVFDLVKRINRKMDNIIISDEEEKEQEENIREIPEIINRLNMIVENIDKLDEKNSKELLSEYIELHLAIGEIEWQYDQLHEIIRKVIGNIPAQK